MRHENYLESVATREDKIHLQISGFQVDKLRDQYC